MTDAERVALDSELEEAMAFIHAYEMMLDAGEVEPGPYPHKMMLAFAKWKGKTKSHD